MVTTGAVLTAYTKLTGVICPRGPSGVVGPKPVPTSVMVSPGFAGTVMTLGNTPLFSAIVESRWFAAMYGCTHVKNAGERGDITTATAGIVFDPPTIRIWPDPE